MADQLSGCQTCYGSGEIVSDHGATVCPDCYGDGKPAIRGNKLEWRLRDLEKSYRGNASGCFPDLMWLVHEVRQARDALTLILTRCQDADEGDEMAKYVRAQAMKALSLYDQLATESLGKREET